jgi:hypothetical protein
MIMKFFANGPSTSPFLPHPQKTHSLARPLRQLACLLQCLAALHNAPFPVLHAVLPQEL